MMSLADKPASEMTALELTTAMVAQGIAQGQASRGNHNPKGIAKQALETAEAIESEMRQAERDAEGS